MKRPDAAHVEGMNTRTLPTDGRSLRKAPRIARTKEEWMALGLDAELAEEAALHDRFHILGEPSPTSPADDAPSMRIVAMTTGNWRKSWGVRPSTSKGSLR